MQKTATPAEPRGSDQIFTLVSDDISGTFSAQRADGVVFDGLDPFGPCAVCQSTERDVRLALYNGEPAIVCESCCEGGCDG